MPRSKTKRGRLKQQENWLRHYFRTPYPVNVVLRRVTEKEFGSTYRKGRKLTIVLNSFYPLSALTDTLNHEWAHAMVWPQAAVENYHPPHSAAWGVAYATIVSAWADEAGVYESRRYPDR